MTLRRVKHRVDPTDGYVWQQRVFALCGWTCVDCGRSNKDLALTGGRLEADHVLTQQRLRKRGYGDKIWDPRNGLARCVSCHAARTSGRRRLDPKQVPSRVWEFADELGLRHVLERECESRA